jgi:hypothetical protein
MRRLLDMAPTGGIVQVALKLCVARIIDVKSAFPEQLR